jgi:plastocyanin
VTQRDKFALALMVVLVALVVRSPAQGVNVTGRVTYFGSESPPGGISAVVWLVPIASPANDPPTVKQVDAVLRQKNKAFEPHLLVVTKGSTVQFPNQDPWFHNVFSLFNGKKFDLGLYEAGTTRTVHFDREGVSYIFCNIHPEIIMVRPQRAASSPSRKCHRDVTRFMSGLRIRCPKISMRCHARWNSTEPSTP